MISVIIPAYQSEDTIASCLDSLFTQTFKDFEVIVVNDGSTDKTREILKKYEPQVRVIDQDNKGRNPARNQGREEARGEFLLFLDSDITMRPEMLELMLKALNDHSEASYAYSSFQYGKKLFRLWPFDEKRLGRMPYIMTSSLVRAKDFPGFDESVQRLQDWDVWLTMLEQGKKGIWIPRVLFVAKPLAHGLSHWLPRWVFWIPWNWFGWKPKRVQDYEKAVAAIKKKHGLFV